MRFRALGVAPVRILHSDKQWTIDTAERIAAKLGAENKTAKAAYPINTGDPVAPFMAEIGAGSGDIMMCGHVEYLLRSASRLVCGDESRKVVEFKPGNGTAVCIEGKGDQWVITYAWRQDHTPG
jgi:phosphohistidine phosphatase SixA